MTISKPDPIRVAVWGSGNMGRAALRAVAADPKLQLAALIVNDRNKIGRDAAEFSGAASPTGVLATNDHRVVQTVDAVAYMASGDMRPAEAVADIVEAMCFGKVVVTPSAYPLYYAPLMPLELQQALRPGIDAGGRLFASGIDPGWANDVLTKVAAGLTSNITEVRSQELFDYSSYDQPYIVREIIGFGKPMEYEPLMAAAGVVTSVWAGALHLMAQTLGVRLERIDEVVDRRPLETDVETRMGAFAKGTQGGLRFEVRGFVENVSRVVVEHVTRIAPSCAPDWPAMADGSSAHRLIIEGEPRLTISVEAEAEGNNRAAGGNATAAHRLLGAIPWLLTAAPGLYNGADVPLADPAGRMRLAGTA